MKTFDLNDNRYSYDDFRNIILNGEHIDTLITDEHFCFNFIYYDLLDKAGENEITELPVDIIDCSKTTTLKGMFYDLDQIIKAPKLINTEHITCTNDMFYGCSSLEIVPLFDTQNVESFTNMFYGCSKLKTVPHFNTKNAKFMDGMFEGCSSLETVPNFNMLKVEDTSLMFADCINLKNYPVFECIFEMPAIKQVFSMFKNCSSLPKIPKIYTNTERFMKNLLTGKYLE